MNEINLNTQTDSAANLEISIKSKVFFFGLVIKAFQF